MTGGSSMNRINRKSMVTTALANADVPFSSYLYGTYAPLDVYGKNAAQPLLAADNLAAVNLTAVNDRKQAQ